MKLRPISTTFSTLLDQPVKSDKKITNNLMDELLRPIKISKLAIFDTHQTIERYFNYVIARHFLGRFDDQGRIYRDRFDALILSSDWCSFSAKLNLVLHIVEEEQILKGKSKENYNKLIRRSMDYRNAFAHGHLSTDGEIVKLSYYKSKPIQRVIDQDYLDTIESDLNDAFRETQEIARQLGVIKE